MTPSLTPATTTPLTSKGLRHRRWSIQLILDDKPAEMPPPRNHRQNTTQRGLLHAHDPVPGTSLSSSILTPEGLVGYRNLPNIESAEARAYHKFKPLTSVNPAPSEESHAVHAGLVHSSSLSTFPQRCNGRVSPSQTASQPSPPTRPDLPRLPTLRPGAARQTPRTFAQREAPSSYPTAHARYMTPVTKTQQRSGVSRPSMMEEGNLCGIPVLSGAECNYQLQTLLTGKGHRIQIPVDMQTGSRNADEKRKRNAGASARFRERRKEREKITSETVKLLEQNLKNSEEEAAFYKRERDTLLEVIRQFPSLEAYWERPSSPRHIRKKLSPQRSCSDRSVVAL